MEVKIVALEENFQFPTGKELILSVTNEKLAGLIAVTKLASTGEFYQFLKNGVEINTDDYQNEYSIDEEDPQFPLEIKVNVESDWFEDSKASIYYKNSQFYEGFEIGLTLLGGEMKINIE